MLKLDTTLSAVETVEADVDSLYQSVNQVNIALEVYRSQPCEAFVCGLNPGERGRVYAVINLMNDKKSLIYTAGNLGVDRGRYDDAVQLALEFLEPLGFQLKEVNLNYSAAMRQVILKGITGMKLPGSGKPEWKQRLEEVVATQEGAVEATAREAAKKGLKPQVSIPAAPEAKSAAPAPPAPSRKKEEGGDVTAMLRVELARLRDEMAALEEEAAPRKARLQSLERDLERERSKAAAVAEERDKEKHEGAKTAAAANRTIAALKKELDGARDELASLTARTAEEQQRLRHELDSLQTRNRELEQSREQEQGELMEKLAAAEAAVAELQTLRAELESRLKEQEQEHERELVRLVATAAEAEVRGDEQLQAHRCATHERLAALRQVIDRLWESVGDEAMPSGDDLLQLLKTASPQAPLMRRPGRRVAEREAAEVPAVKAVGQQAAMAAVVPPAAEEVVSDGGEAEQMPQEISEAASVATVEEALPEPAEQAAPPESAAVDDLAVQTDEVGGRGVAELFFPSEPATVAETASPAESFMEPVSAFAEEAPPQSAIPPAWAPSAPLEAPADMFASFGVAGGGGQAATPFVLDSRQDGLVVPAGGLLEMYRSANVQRIAPTGGAPEEGNAYVCAFREGKGERVVAIVVMAKDRQRFVYLPKDASFDRETLVKSALSFLEEIGFFMLAEPLAETVAERKAELESWAPFVSWDD